MREEPSSFLPIFSDIKRKEEEKFVLEDIIFSSTDELGNLYSNSTQTNLWFLSLLS